MITIRTVENIRRGANITLWNGILAFGLGLFYLIFIKFLLKENFYYIGTVWQVFSKYNPEIGFLFIKMMILKAILVISIAITLIFLSNHVLRKKDRNSLLILFVVGIIFWPSLLTFEILDKNLYTIIPAFIGWISFIIGILIPIRYFMQRSYTDY